MPWAPVRLEGLQTCLVGTRLVKLIVLIPIVVAAPIALVAMAAGGFHGLAQVTRIAVDQVRDSPQIVVSHQELRELGAVMAGPFLVFATCYLIRSMRRNGMKPSSLLGLSACTLLLALAIRMPGVAVDASLRQRGYQRCAALDTQLASLPTLGPREGWALAGECRSIPVQDLEFDGEPGY